MLRTSAGRAGASRRIEERGKWGCKSGGQTHYKFITDFPRRATLLRQRVGFETCYNGEQRASGCNGPSGRRGRGRLVAHRSGEGY